MNPADVVLRALLETEAGTAAELVVATGLSRDEVESAICQLDRAGRIRWVRGKREGFWVVAQ